LASWLNVYFSALQRWFLKHTGWISFLHLPHIVLDLFLLSLVEHTIQFFSIATTYNKFMGGTIWCLEFTTITANQNQCGNASPLISSTACFSMHIFCTDAILTTINFFQHNKHPLLENTVWLAPGLASLISLGKVRFLHIVPVKYVLAIGNLLAKIRDVKKLSQKMWWFVSKYMNAVHNQNEKPSYSYNL
jgi:hypothetical protein